MIAAVINGDGVVVNLIVADADKDAPPEGCVLRKIPLIANVVGGQEYLPVAVGWRFSEPSTFMLADGSEFVPIVAIDHPPDVI